MSAGRRSVVLTWLHGQLLSVDRRDTPAAFQVVLTCAAVLVLSSPADIRFHARYVVLCSLSEATLFNRVIL